MIKYNNCLGFEPNKLAVARKGEAEKKRPIMHT